MRVNEILINTNPWMGLINKLSNQFIRCIGILFVYQLLCSAHNLCADEPSYTDYQVKAAYLYNILKFIKPPQDKPCCTLCVGISEQHMHYFTPVTGKTISGHTLKVTQVTGSSNFTECTILFLSNHFVGDWQSTVKALQGQSVLTVGEQLEFLQTGGILNFYLENQTVRLEVNISNLEKSQITLDPKLLKIARTVRDESKN